MDENRKNIIVKEIQYWKDSRLLPEQYCDYLLALYTEGNQPKEKKHKEKKSFRKIFLLLLLIPISVVLLYFTELSFDLQMALFIIFLLAAIILAFYYYKRGMLYQIPLVLAAFLLLLTSVEITVAKFPEPQAGPLFAVLASNCLIWLIAGHKLKLIYFKISAYLGFIILILSTFI